MRSYAQVTAAALAEGLEVMGGFHPTPDDRVPDGLGTILLLGPAEPGFWARVTTSPEGADGRPDPVDRWSARVIAGLADDLGATPLFPFGQPRQPFVSWALRTGRVWLSPAHLMVHDRQGLWMSFRGALGFEGRIPLPDTPTSSPCDTCAGKPCLSACPAGALTAATYDLNACHTYLDSPDGAGCMGAGCAVRRACPAGAAYERLAEQSAHHMRHFHKG